MPSLHILLLSVSYLASLPKKVCLYINTFLFLGSLSLSESTIEGVKALWGKYWVLWIELPLPQSLKCFSSVSKCTADAWRNSLAGVFPESPVCLLGYLRPGPLLHCCFRVPRHGCALRSHWCHRGLHRSETHELAYAHVCVCVVCIWLEVGGGALRIGPCCP